MKLGISIAGAVTALALGGIANAQSTTTDRPSATTSRGRISDSEFAKKAAMSGMKEVKVSEYAAAQASNDDVKQFARRLVQDHTAANEKLRAAASGANIELPADLDAEHRQQVEQLTSLSGSGLDRTYVDKMVESHRKSVAMFEQKSREGTGALAEFASSTLPTLREHLQMAQDLQRRVGATSGTGAAGSTTDTATSETGMVGSTETTNRPATAETTTMTDTTRETTGTAARASDADMPATASRYPLAILLGVGLAALGFALRLKK